MKTQARFGVLAATVLACGAGALALAADLPAGAASSSSSQSSAPGPHWGHHWRGAQRSVLVGTLLAACRQLNLMPQQQDSIRTLITQARTARRAAGGGAGVNLAVLGNPGDPNYATAVQSLKSSAASRIDSESALAQNIYNVLTSDQQKQLPQVLATLQAKREARRATWQHRAATAGTAASG